jgi:metallo-beta-lactamase family protein
MKVSFHGAARTITGSKHLLTLNNGKRILLDCGMFQGLGQETNTLNEHWGFDPAAISFVILSHAHIDHTGLIPKLVKDGFKGVIFSTPATKDLTEILLHDSAEIQTYSAAHHAKKENHHFKHEEPLYTVKDVEETLSRFKTFERGEWFSPDDDVKVLFTNAGHLAGSAVINLVITEDNKEIRIAFTGDIGRYRSVLLAPPAEFPAADYIIMESTYGNKHHDIRSNHIERILKWIDTTCIQRQGKLIIPAFSVGRTQELLYILNQLELEKRLPAVHYFVDSPLSHKATGVIKKYVHHFNDRMQKVLETDDDPFSFEGLKHIETVDDSIKLTTFKEPCVIISASGNADNGRVKHHIHTSVGNRDHTILLSGFCSNHTVGGQLLSGQKSIELFGDDCTIHADVDKIDGMSGHGDVDDLLKFISCQDADKVKGIFLVHGEYQTQQQFAAKLESKGFSNITIPTRHQEIELK